MTLLLNESDVRALLTMPLALETVASRARRRGESTQIRSRCLNPLGSQLGIWLWPCASMN